MKKVIPLLSMLMILSMSLFAQIVEDAPPPPPPPPPPPSQEVFKVVEQMPMFPGCKEVESKVERKECAQKKLINYISENLVYPKLAKDNNVEGMVVIQFVVQRDGTISDAKILRDIGANCGKAALAVIEKMNEDNIRWISGKQRGRPVAVQINQPISFKIPKKSKQ